MSSNMRSISLNPKIYQYKNYNATTALPPLALNQTRESGAASGWQRTKVK